MNHHDLLGKNVERRRLGDDWNYRFNVEKQTFRGPCGTTDKRAAETMAAKLKQDTRDAIRSTPRAIDAARAAITKGEPFVLLLPSRDGYIANIDRRDILAILKAQIERIEEAINAQPHPRRCADRAPLSPADDRRDGGARRDL